MLGTACSHWVSSSLWFKSDLSSKDKHCTVDYLLSLMFQDEIISETENSQKSAKTTALLEQATTYQRLAAASAETARTVKVKEKQQLEQHGDCV